MDWYLLSGVIGWAIGLLMGWLIGWALGWTYEAARAEKEELSPGEDSDCASTLSKADVWEIIREYCQSEFETPEEADERLENLIRQRIDALPRTMWRSLSDRVEKLERFHSDNMVPVTLESMPGPGESLPEIQPGSEASKIKRMDLNEFRDAGYLQEVNRHFLHPLGLALEVYQDDSGKITHLGGIWDYRDDPEGMAFGELCLRTEESKAKADFIAKEFDRRSQSRKELFGSVIQPISAPLPRNPLEPIPETWNGA